MYENDYDKFARLKAIESGQTSASAEARFWNYEKDGNIMGTIIGFNSFEHPQYGKQHTVTVRLADSNELISAFLNVYLLKGMSSAQVGDLILIQFFGKQPGERFNRYQVDIEKIKSEFGF